MASGTVSAYPGVVDNQYLLSLTTTLVGGRTILPSMIDGIERIANASDPLKFVYEAISYKPFLSLFNMTGIAEANPQLAGVGA